ncbi:DUF4221 family protein [Algoriphagus antarcticus]|uniref:Uncharacterized protein DUF4221 n=1 Tax=Algoriphagus antarcticus TaxID=238540 RepID=A0A3E0DXQ8_9BACT|nr:DUF4221 family protein [Algoriphagus antarcticus]REG88359.1 uncharacterized protein DUF4221 [Algoriphagus antarcticus]
MKNIFILLGLLLFFCSCGKDGKNSNEAKVLSLKLEDQKIIPVNDKSANFSILSQVHFEESGHPLYIHLNYFSSDPNYLFVNSFDDPSLDQVLEFESEGPNGVGNVTEFYFQSYDSIFLVDRYRYLVSIADSAGKVKRSYRLKSNTSNKLDEDSVLPYSSSKARMFVRGNYLYIPCVPDTDSYIHQYGRDNLLIKLDLETGDYTTLLGYPAWYQNGNYWGGPDHVLPSITPLDDLDKVLVSFPLVDSVYMLDLKTEKMKSHFWMGSSNMDSPVAINYDDSQLEPGKRFQLETDYYFSLNYDPFREEYWRFFYKKYDEESIDKIIKREKGEPNQTSLIIYDKNLELIGEFEVDKNWRASGYDLFFLKEGAYISSTPDSIEDQMIFRQLIVN